MLTKEQRIQLYTLLYTKVSKATAEIESGKTVTKQVYRGTLTNLFESKDYCPTTLTTFLWAISHKTNALPTALFKITKYGRGVEICRINSGFYNDKGEHIIGSALIPFIMEAMREYKPTRKYNKHSIDLDSYSDSKLQNLIDKCNKILDEREVLRTKQNRLQKILESTGLSKDELLDILQVC